MKDMPGLAPDVSVDALATDHSWWWILELSLVVALMACCALSIGFIIRGRRASGERPRGGLLWLDRDANVNSRGLVIQGAVHGQGLGREDSGPDNVLGPGQRARPHRN